jgi:putative flippase GtrA
MRSIVATHKNRVSVQLFFYCLCGGIGVTTDYCIYYIVLRFGVWYQVANILSYASGTLVSFFLNRSITFQTLNKTGRRLAMFFGVAAVGYGVSAAMLSFLVGFASIEPRISKLMTLPVVVVIQFLINRRITFSKAIARPPDKRFR